MGFGVRGGYRDESGNSCWRIHAAMTFMETMKIKRDEFNDHYKWHQCSTVELEDFYEGHEGKPFYPWKCREVRAVPGRPQYIRTKLGPVVWASFKLEDVVEEGVV